ncbi:acyl-[acyl-carrier-protein] thioesterase [Hyphobacterium marinum]|uniref:Acyl-[acyl-carrier-protein] thioesterase n=1 Tax=Hyphobacterium marinum TaxID=3116574 RepID=A0ABU7LWL1_9PROT|nr:acyl-[acyl-carrier-protein] thioesterase [Hyphobacterium sp. Y6023]MEE2565931.1 acyl-[acyl-carrier-protein] thioesterase [Hyphobacterium sp. Y6023]
MRDLWRGNANAWECDELGHLNVKFYLAKAMEAVAHLAQGAGMTAPFRGGATATLLLREVHINFLAEARPGAPLVIRGGFTSLDENSCQAALVMEHGDGRPAAGLTLRLDHAVPTSGQVFPWPSRFADMARQVLISPPEPCSPRGLPPHPGRPNVSLKAADQIGLTEIGRGAFSPADCDVFGFLRPEGLLAKVSDSVIHFREAFPEEWDSQSGNGESLGGALLEGRIRARGRPRAGDLFVIRSGLVEANPNVRRLVHWVLDPVSGQPWWTTEGVAAMLDLKARRIRKMEDERLSALRAVCRKDLAG